MTPISTNSKTTKNSNSLVAILATTIVTLGMLALLIASIPQLWLNYEAQRNVVSKEQQLAAISAADDVSAFIEQIFDNLETVTQITDSPADASEDAQDLFQQLLGVQPAIRDVALVNVGGQEFARQSRSVVVRPEDYQDWNGDILFETVSEGERYISPVSINEITSEPEITLAIPINTVLRDFEGALVAVVNLQFMWDRVASLQIGDTGQAYVVDDEGRLLAFGDVSRVLSRENVSYLEGVARFLDGANELGDESVAITTGIEGENVVSTFVPLKTPNWAVVIEQPAGEAYQNLIQTVLLSIGALMFVAILAVGVGVYVARRLSAPIVDLTETATHIAEGNFNLQASLVGPAEVVNLAQAFNSMKTQLQGFIDTLEQRVTERTRRLESVASLGERLSSILKVEELLPELVNQVKDSFDYYHVHVYIFNKDRTDLVMTAGAGEAGEKMKLARHQIAADAPTSLVARAARNQEIVWVDDVRQSPDWLPNPLLPDTKSEMAVPIILDGEVVGVLDVQQDKVAGLDEGDAGLLRSLANQAAVAIRNARLFNEVETALTIAKATQAQYINEAWQDVSKTEKQITYQHVSATLEKLDGVVVNKIDQEARLQPSPTFLTPTETLIQMDSNGSISTDVSDQNNKTTQSSVLVAPIKLQEQIIGAIQLHGLGKQQQWSGREIALVQAIIDQVAQTAENLRLFDETRERASREQLISQVGDKLRQAPDLETLMKLGVEELSKALSTKRTFIHFGVETEVTKDQTQPSQTEIEHQGSRSNIDKQPTLNGK